MEIAGETVVRIIKFILESDELVRVCAACEKEFGPVPLKSGQHKSHGMCKRHMLEYYGPDIAQNMPDNDYCPDLFKPSPTDLPESLDPDKIEAVVIRNNKPR